MDNSKLEILDRPVSDLNLSADCKTYLKNNGIDKLVDVTNKGWKGMRETDGFDYVLFNEVIRFLDGAGLVHLMEK
jgi:hypothetical protein